MLIPYNTDAPIYHWPLATVGLIVLNTVIFFGTSLPEPEPQFGMSELSEILEESQEDEDHRHPWTLWYGDGWHPTQWVTSNFMHADFWHLLGNMFFLWAFGLVIEGKLGWWRFLLVYMGIGVAQSALQQTIVAVIPAAAGHYEYSLGASAAIFGLLAMALIWAPKNDIHCLLIIYLYPIMFDIPIYVMAVVGTSLEFLFAGLGGFGMSSAMLHLMGAGFGLVVGIAMLKLNWVDCENWDVFSLRKDRAVKLLGDIRAEQRALREELLEESASPAASEAHDEKRRAAALRNIPEYLDAGAHQPAAALFWETDRACPEWQLPERDHLRLIVAFHQAGHHRESIPLMTRYLRDHDRRAAQVRIKLAEILIRHDQRPSKALRVLEKIPHDQLTPQVSARVIKLRAETAKQIVEGVLELEGDDDDV